MLDIALEPKTQGNTVTVSLPVPVSTRPDRNSLVERAKSRSSCR